MPTPDARFLTAPGIRPTLAMLVLLVATLSVGAWGLVTGRRDAQRAVRLDLKLRTEAEAGALEAALASLRGDVLFLAQVTIVHDLPDLLSDPDPVSRRWGRLAAEATMLRFLESHPEIHALAVFEETDAGRDARIVAAKRDGVPIVADVDTWSAPVAADLQRGTWAVGDVPRFHVDVFASLQALLDRAAPRSTAAVRVLPADGVPDVDAAGSFCARAAVHDSSWVPPVLRTVEMCAGGGSALRAELDMASRFRSTLGLSAGLALLSLLMGVVAYREVRRGVAADAARAHETRVRELERQVLHSERLASVGRLAAGIAHEVNNPLEGMSNYLTLLGDDVSAGRRKEALETVDRLRDGIDRVASVTRHVLDYSDPGRAPKRPVDLRTVVRETTDFLRSKPEFRRNDIVLSAPEEPVVIEGDSVTLGQVFLNLILNALEARPEGRVDVRFDREPRGAGEWIAVSVRDHGPGISEDARDKIFEPFYSGRGSTGLGLSVCFGIVQAHGGEIDADNDPEGGAVLTVRLPLTTVGEGPA